MNAIHSLLREKQTLFDRLRTPRTWHMILLQLAVASLLGMAGFGAIMGSFTQHWWWPLQMSGKTIVVFWATFALCTPSLLVFSALRGSRITLMQLCYLLVGSLATSGVVFGALLPIAWFFSWTDETHYGPAVHVIHIVAFLFAFFFGLQYLKQGLLAYHEQQQETDRYHQSASDILVLWSILVMIVGVQMANKIGPWYEQNLNKVCTGGIIEQMCFPRETIGTPLHGLSIEGEAVHWTPGSAELQTGDYHTLGFGEIVSHTWKGLSATCVVANSVVECSVDLKALGLQKGETVVLQANGNREQFGNAYTTEPLTFTR